MRIVALLGLLLAMTAVPAQAAGVRCAQPTVTTFHTGADWYENLEFVGDEVWISNHSANRVEIYGLDGTSRSYLDINAPGAIRTDREGTPYVNFGNNTAPHALRSGVIQLTAKPHLWTPEGALSSANGAEFDARDHLYVADPFEGLVEFSRRGELVRRIPLPGANGVATIGNTVYTALFTDPKSAVVRINGTRQTRFELGADKNLDDLAVGPDGRLYVTAFGSGEIIKLDPRTGASCVLLTGLDRPTAARFLPHTRDMFVTLASGKVLRVRISQR